MENTGNEVQSWQLLGAVVKVTCACWNAAMYQDHLPLCPATLTFAVPLSQKLHGPLQLRSSSDMLPLVCQGCVRDLALQGTACRANEPLSSFSVSWSISSLCGLGTVAFPSPT